MTIWRSGFWKSYGILLWRSRHDKRARRAVLKITLALAYILACVVIFLVLPLGQREGVWQIVFNTLIWGSAAIVAFLLRRSHRKQDALLNYSLTGASAWQPSAAEISATVRQYLEE